MTQLPIRQLSAVLLALAWVAGPGPAAPQPPGLGGPGDNHPEQSIRPLIAHAGPVAWSVQGDRIAFSRPDADGYQKLWIAGPDGLGDRCLTCDPLEFRNRHSGNPAWHPSGRYIVFVLERPHKEAGRPVPFGRVPGANRGDDLWAISIDGKTFIKITNRGESGGHVISPRFSHEGDRLAWGERLQSGGGPWGGWVLRVGRFTISRGLPRIRRVKTHKVGDSVGFYEPYGFTADDRSLLFAANLDPGQPETALDLYTLNLEDHALHRLTASDLEMDRFASLSPEGSDIVWSSSQGAGGTRATTLNRGGDTDHLPLDLWMMDVRGGYAHRLTHFNDPLSAAYAGRVQVTSPTWNRTGDRLLVLVTPLEAPSEGGIYSIELTSPLGE